MSMKHIVILKWNQAFINLLKHLFMLFVHIDDLSQ